MEKKSRKTDIAVIGMSGKFPKSDTLKVFWENLSLGKELIHFYSDEELKSFNIEEDILNNTNFIKANSFINNSGSFDYSFFGYTKAEAMVMDPQIRIMHEQAWSALEDAGCDVSSYKGKIGLYVSASDNLNWKAYVMGKPDQTVNPFLLHRISDKNFISTLISYSLDLKGPSYYIDTACSSSLVAVHLACRNLLMKECSMALAGGISVNTSKAKGYLYEEGLIASKDGHCKAFDKESTGTVWGEGAGVVVLKRLEDAQKNNDHIYAVIRSSAVNNDGKRKVGYTAPSVNGQSDCIKLAHRIAGVSPDSISYIEAHGTGTKLGDPIEIEALNKAFNYNSDHKCAIGSVKTNMGHLDAAAGIAGFIKTCLILKNKTLLPSLHYKNPNPEINFETGPIYVNTELKKWERNREENSLKAGVSSFGIGGTNSHIILEEAPELQIKNSKRSFQLLVYSAGTSTALNKYRDGLEEFITDEEKNSNLNNLAYTLNTGRKFLKYRNSFVCKNKEEALRELERLKTGKFPSVVKNARRNIVFMFSGQGSQYFGMAKDIYNEEPFFKAIMEEGFQILKQQTGENYAKILGYDTNDPVDEQLINKTKYTQPLLFLVEYALAKLLLNWGIKPDYMIGHSLGEYVAACISDVFSFEDAIHIILKRAHLMSTIEEGDMLAIGKSASSIQPLLNDELSIAVINTENSCVVSGNKEDISKLIELISEKEEIPYTKLKTSHAFHSKMMDSILDDYEKELSKCNFSSPKYSFISNLSGKEILSDEAVSAKYWVKHLRETVNFYEGIDHISKKGNSIFIEIGPGNTLLNFLKQNKNIDNNSLTANSLRRSKNKENDNRQIHAVLGVLWEGGANIDWQAYYQNETLRKTPAPTYPFETTSLPVKVDPFEMLQGGELFYNPSKPGTSKRYYVQNWKKSFLQINAKKPIYNYLVFSNEKTPYTKLLIGQLRQEGSIVIEVSKGEKYKKNNEYSYAVTPGNEEDFIKLFNAIEAISIDQILFNWTFEEQLEKEASSLYATLLFLYENLKTRTSNAKKKVTFLSHLKESVIGNERDLSKTYTLKNIQANGFDTIFSCHLDIGQNSNTTEIVLNIINELKYNRTDVKIALRNNNRWIQFYDQITLNTANKESRIKKDKTYLIIGQSGRIGAVLTAYLNSKYNAKIITLENQEENEEQLEESNLQSFKMNGENAVRYKTNISDLDEVRKAIGIIEENYGNISGVIYPIIDVDNQSLAASKRVDSKASGKGFDVKIEAVRNLCTIFKENPLDFVWLPFGIVSTMEELVNDARGLTNVFIKNFINQRRNELKNWFCISIDDTNYETLLDEQFIEIFEESLSENSPYELTVSFKSLESILNEATASGKKHEEGSIQANTERPEVDAKYEPPGSEGEKKICDLWQTFFSYDRIGVNDDFFELGGDSLKAMFLLRKIQKLFNIEINIQDFYEKPTIKELSNEINLALKLIDIQKKNKIRNKTIKI